MTPLDPVTGVERTEPQTLVQFLFKSGAQFQILVYESPKEMADMIFSALIMYRDDVSDRVKPRAQFIRVHQWVKERGQYSECIINLENLDNADVNTATKRPPNLAIPGEKRGYG